MRIITCTKRNNFIPLQNNQYFSVMTSLLEAIPPGRKFKAYSSPSISDLDKSLYELDTGQWILTSELLSDNRVMFVLKRPNDSDKLEFRGRLRRNDSFTVECMTGKDADEWRFNINTPDDETTNVDGRMVRATSTLYQMCILAGLYHVVDYFD